tara:strand:- start:433 stop:2745 length:2313 start_codon:yes stop_codon:yes gene_type:complete
MNRNLIIKFLNQWGITFTGSVNNADLKNLFDEARADRVKARTQNAEPTARNVISVANMGGEGEAVVLIRGPIGEHWEDEPGVSGIEFENAFNAIPEAQNVLVDIHSPGGNIWDGLLIYGLIAANRDRVRAKVSGVAFSAASFIAMAANSVEMSRHGRMMIHGAQAMAYGDSDELRGVAEMLEGETQSIARIYADKTGKPVAEIEAMMKATTFMDGEQAKALGFVDVLTEDAAMENRFDASAFNSAIRNQFTGGTAGGDRANKKRTNTMNEKLINQLIEWNVTVPENISDTDLLTLYNQHSQSANTPAAPAPANTQTATAPSGASPRGVDSVAVANQGNRIDQLEAQLATQRTADLTNRFHAAAENRVPAADRANMLDAVLTSADPEALLSTVANLAEISFGAAPMPTVTAEASVADVSNHIGELVHMTNRAFMRGEGSITAQDVSDNANRAAQVYNQHRGQLLEVFNANTLSADLQRTVFLNETMGAFSRRLIALNVFSTVFSNVPLEGFSTLAKVSVPYFDLVAGASTDFDQSNGYVMGDSTLGSKVVTIDKRKYQPIRFNSAELSRLPIANLVEVGKVKAGKLALDVFADVLSVVTAANYSTAAFTGAASTFDYSDVVDIGTECGEADWTEDGRGMILTPAYVGALRKDGTVSDMSKSGGDVARTGSVGNVSGFDVFESNHIPANSENLVGAAVHKSAMVIATAPIIPDEAVRSQLVRYELVVDPATGIAFEYRLWGNSDLDERREVIEVNYGKSVGQASAIKRIVSA